MIRKTRDLEGVEILASPFRSLGGKGRMAAAILEYVPREDYARWVEPFAGTCVVGFTERPARALFSDSLPYVMEFFRMLKEGSLDPYEACEKLGDEYRLLSRCRRHYGAVANRLLKHGDPLDYLFLSKTCYGGATRFSKGRLFNAPFSNRVPSGKDLERTLMRILAIRGAMTPEWEFRIGGYHEAFDELSPDDVLYCDPPYRGLSVGYWPPWGKKENELFIEKCAKVPCPAMVSLWLERKGRKNPEIARWKRNGFECVEIPMRSYIGKSSGYDALLVRI